MRLFGRGKSHRLPTEPGSSRAARPDSGGNLSILSADFVLHGDVETGSGLRIDGHIDGNIRCRTLVQGIDSHVAGAITAEVAQLGGAVDGDIRVRRLTLEPSARVQGDVEYETLAIGTGSRIDGRLSRLEFAATPDSQ